MKVCCMRDDDQGKEGRKEGKRKPGAGMEPTPVDKHQESRQA